MMRLARGLAAPFNLIEQKNAPKKSAKKDGRARPILFFGTKRQLDCDALAGLDFQQVSLL